MLPTLSALYHQHHCILPNSCCCSAPTADRPTLSHPQPPPISAAAVSLVKDKGFTDINICYSSPRGDDLDTRLLRAMVIKGILEGITTANVNLVNADLLAKNRGLRISEITVRSEGRSVITSTCKKCSMFDSCYFSCSLHILPMHMHIT